ncbi:HAMP domain-containing sensor histidine kinase [Pseudoxanthomonas sp. PXM02]|uniref:sensor histidine kinase n=1 Tax=Pseudoxanthomonas sp. PXM02 TaxID=2769294 RepID=UPI00177F139E|nr:HAMP domain-containing sensor histidine kinase [Pseudoxanthomonas sp. PXM02]MBD9478115.1 HAMP domain-containing histidine kinase [Pseudoxanthomonas sp. PXM02]
MIFKPRGVHGGITVALVVFGLIMMTSLTFQNFSSQGLIEHRYWADLLREVSDEHAALVRTGDALPQDGLVRSWYIAPGAATSAPDYLADLPPGEYSTENGFRNFTELEGFEGHGSFHAVVVDLPPGRLVTALDIGPIEDQQNRTSWWSLVWALSFALMIWAVIAWLHANLVRPVRDLADRMQAIDPRDSTARLPTTYLREEIQVIAQASNVHLERVGQFIERERSLLDQASHEFRTPIAVIAGAVDVLKQMPLPDTSQPALARIEHAVEGLSETMVALLYLAREPEAGSEPAEVTALHECLPRIVEDHEHLLAGRGAQLRVGELPPTYLAAPEAMVRIAVSNLIRNAIENTEAGYVEVTLSQGVIAVVDSGSGFNPVEAARRYRESLRRAAPTRGQGLGLFLIGRICERFGWRLAIDAGTVAGTRAHLDVSASVIPL